MAEPVERLVVEAGDRGRADHSVTHLPGPCPRPEPDLGATSLYRPKCARMKNALGFIWTARLVQSNATFEETPGVAPTA
jgi:hypothetical protein